MVKSKLGLHTFSDDDQRVLVNLFRDPQATQEFVRLLHNVKLGLVKEQSNITQTYLMNDNPVTRGLALQCKGKVEFLDELLLVINNVNR